MVAVTNQNDGALLARELQRLEVNLGHQRASGIDDLKRSGFSFFPHRRRHSMGAEDQHRAMGHVIDGLHKNSPTPPKLLYYVGVMDNFVMDVHRGAISFQRQLHNVHGPNHSRAKTSRSDP